MARHVLLLGLVALLAGCGTSDDREQSEAVVERFYAAIEAGDPAVACEQLSESTLEQLESQTEQSCEGVITRLDYEGGSISSTEVYVTNAKVDLESGESAFLSRERDGWKLSAIACKAEKGKAADRPFECEVES